jgi:hypothetical protein
MLQKTCIFVLTTIFLFSLFIPPALSQAEKVFERDLLIQDARQLIHIFENAHPDPYIRGGGKIAFHRRFQDILRAIPEEGMTKKEFYKLLLPFVAAVGDGHTRVFLSESREPAAPGLPLVFNIVEEMLYVAGVYDKSHEPLLGAALNSIEGVPFAELVNRQTKLRGCDNEYHALLYLTRFLNSKEGLESLLPEWNNNEEIKVEFRLPSGDTKEYSFAIPEQWPENPITPESKIKLPSTEKTDFVYSFLDEEKKIALLRVDRMTTFRETFEFFNVMGVDYMLENARKEYERFQGKQPPADIKDVIEGIPSVTELFRSLVIEMKKAGTKALIIDIRKNGGGNSVMSDMLIYFLYGKESWKSLEDGFSIKKYSDYYFKQYQEDTIEKINKDRDLPLTKDDYDFESERKYRREKGEEREDLKEFEEFIKLMPTFDSEYQSLKYNGYYSPEKVIVLCSPATYSSGFSMTLNHYRLGAMIVGTPSAQAGNSFGDMLGFHLNNSDIYVTVSYKYGESFPDDPEKGRVLHPQYELTYQKLQSFGFDPNAEVLYALELLSEKK